MNEVTIEVTQEDIDEGVACDTHKCAFALAVERRYGPSRVSVNPLDTILFNKNLKLIHPPELTRWIDAIDGITLGGPAPLPGRFTVTEDVWR